MRQGSYTDAAVALLVQAAGGAVSGDPNATGALEASRGPMGPMFCGGGGGAIDTRYYAHDDGDDRDGP